jgi:hypothetical protein
LLLAILAERPAKASIVMIKNIIFCSTFLLILSCEPVNEVSGIPNVAVSVELNLNDIDNANLKQIGGFVYAQGGVKGLVVIHESKDTYRVFDRNCTFQPSDACAIVEMHSSGFFLNDDCCGSTFDLSGFATGAPAEFPLKEYRTSLGGDILFIFN